MHQKLRGMRPRKYRQLADALLAGEGISFPGRRPCLTVSFPCKGRSIFVVLLKEGLRPIQILVATTLVSQSSLVSERVTRIQWGQKFARLD